MLFDCHAVVAIDVFLKSLIIVSASYHQRHVVSETGFKQDSMNPNPYSDSLIEYCFLLNPNSDSLCI